LYFRPDGVVSTCCTTAFGLARYRGADGPTLREIWDGARLRRQRDALDAGDFSLGCQECEVPLASGNRRQTLAHQFDRFDGPGPFEFPRMIDFAISSACNLQCVMCNGGLSSSIRAHREHLPPLVEPYDDLFFEQLRDFIPHLVRAQFKGGEPFLSRSTQRIWDLMLDVGVPAEVTVTTNATIWNDRVEHYLRHLRMHPNISVDGVTAATIESIRVGSDAERIWQNVDRFAAVAAESGTGMTLSFCLMPQNWHEFGRFLLEVERRGLDGNVILVNQPRHCDLTQLPTPRLRSVVRRLEEEGVGLRGQLGSTLHLWDGYVGRLRDHLRRPVELRVSDGPQPSDGSFYVGSESAASDDELRALGRPVLSADQARSAQFELQRWGGREPIVAVAVGNIVQRVEAPDWSSWLNPHRWVGGALESVLLEIERVGTEVEFNQAERDGVLWVEGSMRCGPAEIDFRSQALVCRDDAGQRVARVCVVTRTDPPNASR
jgi:hypothetical protein